MTNTVVGLFDNRSEAQLAMQELVQEGFIKENIDLSNRSTADTNTTAASNTTNDEGIGDSIGNFFSSLFGDDEETAANYTNAAYDADAILTIQADSAERARQAAEILDRHGAIDVDERNMQHSRQNLTNSSDTMTTGDTTNMAQNRTNLENETAIPVIEEELQVGKREVERGGARIRSRIIEKPVEASVRLREEHVVVNRRPVNRAVTDADMNNFREGEIELTEHAEVPVVGKQARVVEEVEVGKTVEEHDQTIRDTVRRTDVDVQEIDTDAVDADDVSHTGTRRANS
jgi:uncharacterized protein (TIGR02271 family)